MYCSVAFSLFFTIQGFPNTIEWEGMSRFTYVLGAIKTSSPIEIFPTIVELTPIHTSSPIVGVPSLIPLFS